MAAVNRAGSFGTWRYLVVEDPPALAKLPRSTGAGGAAGVVAGLT